MFSADGQRVLSWSEDGTARLWSAGNSQLMALFRHERGVNSASFDHQEQRVLTVSADGTVRIWDISFDASIPIEERVVEFEVRSATTLAPNGEVRVLTESEWAARKQRLAELRRTLRQRMQNSPLMDAPRFARNIETTYRQMWQKWCAAPGTA